MSHSSRSRSFSWSSALRTIKSDRAPVVPGLLAARGLASAYSRSLRTPLVIRSAEHAPKFDRAAIMTVATMAARDHQAKHGGTWAAAMAVCLKAAWQSAKLSRNGIVH